MRPHFLIDSNLLTIGCSLNLSSEYCSLLIVRAMKTGGFDFINAITLRNGISGSVTVRSLYEKLKISLFNASP